MNYLSNSTTTEFQLVSITVGVTSGYNDMVARPFMTHASKNAIDQLMYNTNNGSNITPESVIMAPENHLVQVPSNNTGVIDVSGGWSHDRNVILMCISEPSTGTAYYLTGFTSPDFMIHGQLNPQAHIVLNNLFKVGQYTDAMGAVRTRLISTDSVLANTAVLGDNGNPSISVVQRPVDTMDQAVTNYLNAGMQNPTMNFNALSSTANAGTASLSKATNALSSEYLYRSTRAIANTAFTTDPNGLINGAVNSDPNVQLLDDAKVSSIVQENDFMGTSLLRYLITNTANRISCNLSVNDLMLRFSNLASIIQPLSGDAGAMTANTNDWRGRLDAKIATELASSIPAAMMRSGLSALGFIIQSEDPQMSVDGMPNTFAVKPNPMDPNSGEIGTIVPNLDVDSVNSLLGQVVATLRTIIFPSVFGTRRYSVDISASIYKDCVISMSVDGYDPVVYVAPSFASSQWSPVNSASYNSFMDMGTGMLNITQAVMEGQQSGLTTTA